MHSSRLSFRFWFRALKFALVARAPRRVQRYLAGKVWDTA